MAGQKSRSNALNINSLERAEYKKKEKGKKADCDLDEKV